jgi:hypothetical protein
MEETETRIRERLELFKYLSKRINNEADIFIFDLNHFGPMKALGLKMIR